MTAAVGVVRRRAAPQRSEGRTAASPCVGVRMMTNSFSDDPRTLQPPFTRHWGLRGPGQGPRLRVRVCAGGRAVPRPWTARAPPQEPVAAPPDGRDVRWVDPTQPARGVLVSVSAEMPAGARAAETAGAAAGGQGASRPAAAEGRRCGKPGEGEAECHEEWQLEDWVVRVLPADQARSRVARSGSVASGGEAARPS